MSKSTKSKTVENTENTYTPEYVITHMKICNNGQNYNINYGHRFISVDDNHTLAKDIKYFLDNGGVIEPEITDEDRLNDIKRNFGTIIDKARDNAINEGVTFKGHIFQSAEKDRNLLTSTVTLYGTIGSVPEDFVWISKDNKFVPMTLQELVQLGGLMGKAVNDYTIKARILKDAMTDVKSLKEANIISWYSKYDTLTTEELAELRNNDFSDEILTKYVEEGKLNLFQYVKRANSEVSEQTDNKESDN